MIVDTVLRLSLGLLLIVNPQLLVDLFFEELFELSKASKIVLLAFGSTLTIIGTMEWCCRNAKPSTTRNLFLFLPIVTNLVSVNPLLLQWSSNLNANVAFFSTIPYIFIMCWASWLLIRELGPLLK